MKTTAEKLNEVRSNGYEFNFGQVFEQTFENYKKIALIGGAVFLVFAILLIVLSVGLGAMFGMASFMSGGLTGMKNMEGLTALSILVKVGVAVLTAAFVAPLNAGMLKMAHNAETYREFSFSTAFDHYKSGYFKNIFVATLITTMFSQAFQLTFEMFQLYNAVPAYTFIFGILNFIISCFIGLLTLFVLPLIIFGDLSASEAIKGSVMLVFKKFWVLLILALLVFVCAGLGIIGICIGVFFTVPIIYSFQYIAYRNAVEIDDADEMEEIGLGEDNTF
ncbi:MAG: hypothetical protein PSV16_04545 [Flavobacterium sp.]|nr:hypothetical protein [Flavobacterium sp.]